MSRNLLPFLSRRLAYGIDAQLNNILLNNASLNAPYTGTCKFTGTSIYCSSTIIGRKFSASAKNVNENTDAKNVNENTDAKVTNNLRKDTLIVMGKHATKNRRKGLRIGHKLMILLVLMFSIPVVYMGLCIYIYATIDLLDRIEKYIKK